MRINVIVFEGGHPACGPEREMAAVRSAVTLDVLELCLSSGLFQKVILATNIPSLGAQARELGAWVEETADDGFHFGRALQRVLQRHPCNGVVYLSGAGMPLLRRADLQEVVEHLRTGHVVVMNNPLSADLVAFSPTRTLSDIDLPATDNFLGYLLREAGLRRVLMTNTARVNFDIDTPTDILILALQAKVGARTAAATRSLAWDPAHLQRAAMVLTKPMAEVGLIGRVGAPIIAQINSHFSCRLRIYSEERGMKALGREERGEVRSLIGVLMERVGPRDLVRILSDLCDVVFMDTRVLFAHWKGQVSAKDRYYSDLGRWELIEDEDIRAFTRAVVEAKIPFVLGGHSVVSGGLWLMVDDLIERGLGSRR